MKPVAFIHSKIIQLLHVSDEPCLTEPKDEDPQQHQPQVPDNPKKPCLKIDRSCMISTCLAVILSATALGLTVLAMDIWNPARDSIEDIAKPEVYLCSPNPYRAPQAAVREKLIGDTKEMKQKPLTRSRRAANVQIKRIIRPLSLPPHIGWNFEQEPPLYHDSGARCSWVELSNKKILGLDEINYDYQLLELINCANLEDCKAICLRMYKSDDPNLCNYFSWNKAKQLALFYYVDPLINWNITNDDKVTGFFWKCTSVRCDWFWRRHQRLRIIERGKPSEHLVSEIHCRDFGSCQRQCETHPTCNYVLAPTNRTVGGNSFLYTLPNEMFRQSNFTIDGLVDSFEMFCKENEDEQATILPPSLSGNVAASVAPAIAVPAPPGIVPPFAVPAQPGVAPPLPTAAVVPPPSSQTVLPPQPTTAQTTVHAPAGFPPPSIPAPPGIAPPLATAAILPPSAQPAQTTIHAPAGLPPPSLPAGPAVAQGSNGSASPVVSAPAGPIVAVPSVPSTQINVGQAGPPSGPPGSQQAAAAPGTAGRQTRSICTGPDCDNMRQAYLKHCAISGYEMNCDRIATEVVDENKSKCLKISFDETSNAKANSEVQVALGTKDLDWSSSTFWLSLRQPDNPLLQQDVYLRPSYDNEVQLVGRTVDRFSNPLKNLVNQKQCKSQCLNIIATNFCGCTTLKKFTTITDMKICSNEVMHDCVYPKGANDQTNNCLKNCASEGQQDVQYTVYIKSTLLEQNELAKADSFLLDIKVNYGQSYNSFGVLCVSIVLAFVGLLCIILFIFCCLNALRQRNV